MNRRELLQTFAALSAFQACVPLKKVLPTVIEPKEWFYSGYEYDQKTKEGKKVFGIAASSSLETIIFPLKNSIHSVVYDSETRLKVYLPKSGDSAYFQKGDEEPKVFKPDSGNYFYGHGAFDEKRKVFYTTQSKITDDGANEKRQFNKGFIYVHTLDDFRIIDKFPTFGNDPHDLKLLENELMVCNGGFESNICFIDPVTRKLNQSFRVDDDLLSLGHIEVLDSTNFVVVTGSQRSLYPCAMYALNRKTGFKKFPIPEGLDSLFRVQLLSVSHFGNYILATCPHTNSLLVWNKTMEFVGAHHIPDPLSLAVSSELGGVIVGTGENNQPLRLVTFPNGQLSVRALDWGTRSTGSHSLVI